MWEPQDPHSLVHAASTTSASDVPNGISAGMEAIGSLLNESNDQDDEIMQFQGVPGTYSTPKPAGGFFQSPHPAYAHSGNANPMLTEIGAPYNYNGNGFMGTPQPYQVPPAPVHYLMDQQHESMDLSTATLTHSTSEPQTRQFSPAPQEQQVPEVTHPIEPHPRPSGTSVQPYKCDHCAKRFRNMAQLNMHTRKTHPEFVPPESEPESESEDDDAEPDNNAEDADTETDNANAAKTNTDAAEPETNANAAETETTETHAENADAAVTEAKADAVAESSAPVEPQPEANATYTVEPTQDQNQDQLKPEPETEQAVAAQEPAQPAQVRVQQSIFGCPVCHTSYGSSRHLQRHFGTAIHKANVKAQQSTNSEGPQEGIKDLDSTQERKPSEYKCEVCEVSVLDASKLRRHFLTAAHQQKLRASTGGADEDEEAGKGTEETEAAPRRQSMRQRHPPQRAYSPPRPLPRAFKCNLCTLDFESQRGLERHKTTKSHLAKANAIAGPVDDADAAVAYEFECENCAVTFPSAADLEHHYLTAHLSLSQEEIGGPALETSATSTSPKKLSCDVCGFRFKDSYHLRRHFMSQAHQRKVEEQRGIPEVVLREEEEDQDAETETSGSVMFHCETCNTTYKSARQIKRHYATPMHKQNFAGAGAMSAGEGQSTGSEDDDNDTNITNSNTHVYAPTKVRTSITAMHGANDPKRHFKCEACNTFYLSGNHLRRHFTTNSHLAMLTTGGAAAETRVVLPVKVKDKVTSPVKPQAESLSTSCGVCSSSFNSLATLNKHMRKVHPELQPEVPEEEVKLEPSEEEDTGDEEQEQEFEKGATLNLDERISAASGRRLVCEVCNASYRGNYDLQRHFATLLHRTNAQNQTGEGSNSFVSAPRPRISQSAGGSKRKSKTKARSVGDIVGIGHFLGALGSPSSSSSEKNRPKCEACNKFYCSNKDLRKHYLTNIHQQMVAELEARKSGTHVTEKSEEEEDDGAGDSEEEENENESEEQSSGEGVELGHVPPGFHDSSQIQPRGGPTPRKRVRLSCETCGTSYQGQRDLARHFATQKHLQAVNEAAARASDGGAATTETGGSHRPGPKSKTQGQGQYKCNTCETHYSSRVDLEEHKQTSSHLTALRIYLESENQQNGGREGESGEGRRMEEAAGGEID